MIFEDVEVPYERLFIDCNLDAYNGLRAAGWATNVFQQTSTRAAVKLNFAYDLCTRMAQLTNSEKRPDVPIQLGELGCYAAMNRAANQAEQRPRIFSTARDFIGSALGGRVDLYEHFYLASQLTNFRREHMQTLAEGGFGILDEYIRDSVGA